MKRTIYLCGELGQHRSKMTGQPWGKTVSLNHHMQTGFSGAQCSLLSSRYQQFFLFVSSNKEHLHLDWK